MIHIDIAGFQGRQKENLFKKTITQQTGIVLAESACGVDLPNSVVVQLKRPKSVVYSNLIKREGDYDDDYLSLLETQFIYSNYILYDPYLFDSLLLALINREVNLDADTPAYRNPTARK